MVSRGQDLQIPAVLILLSVGFAVVAVPFLLGEADSWDMVGHLAHAQMQRDMLPQIVFWNPYFFSGYEQFTAYPPLLSLLVALLSLPIGLVPAFKLVTLAAWVALPIAIYYLDRGLLEPPRALVATTVTALILVLVQQQIGGTFFSTLVVGNVANALGLVLFALCLGAILRGDLRRAIPLLALLVLTHMIAAVVLSIFIGARLLVERRGWPVFLGYGMAAFWLLPALVGTYRDVSAHDDYPLSPLEYALYVILLVGFVFYRRRSQNRNLDSLVLALAALFFVVGILRYLLPEVWASIPMHFHRVKIYSLVVAVPVIVRMLPQRLELRSGSRAASLALPVMGLVALAILVGGALSRPWVFRDPYEAPDLEVVGERVLTVERLPEIPYWHNFRHLLASRGHRVGKGLFIEASPDAPYVLTLEQLLDAEHQVPLRWGIDWDAALMGDPADSARVLFLLDLFGVQSIVTDRSLISPVPGIQGASGGGYVVVERPTQPLVDVVDYPLKFSGGPLDDRSWQALVRQWFRSGEQILVVDGPPFVAPERGSATLASSDNHFNSLSISVEAEAPTSVLIRMGHSRKWRAWTQDGQLPVHRVTPNNMLVVADEDFELHFQPLDGRNWAGLLISVLSVCGYGFLLRRETA